MVEATLDFDFVTASYTGAFRPSWYRGNDYKGHLDINFGFHHQLCTCANVGERSPEASRWWERPKIQKRKVKWRGTIECL